MSDESQRVWKDVIIVLNNILPGSSLHGQMCVLPETRTKYYLSASVNVNTVSDFFFFCDMWGILHFYVGTSKILICCVLNLMISICLGVACSYLMVYTKVGTSRAIYYWSP
jgi:hypothetical protein